MSHPSRTVPSDVSSTNPPTDPPATLGDLERPRLDPSLVDAALIAELADAAVARVIEDDIATADAYFVTTTADFRVGRAFGLLEALAILVGRPADELRTEIFARIRNRGAHR